MGLGKRYPEIMAEQRRIASGHIAEIEAEQQRRTEELRGLDYSHIPPLRIAERYAGGHKTRPEDEASAPSG